MKKFIYFLFKNKKLKRASNIKAIHTERIARIRETISYLNKWDDIPISFMFTAVCDKLKIAPTKPARDFIIQLSMPNVNIERMAKRLP